MKSIDMKITRLRCVTYNKMKTIANGIKKISQNAAKRRIFVVCNSTIEMSKRAPHHELWPSVC